MNQFQGKRVKDVPVVIVQSDGHVLGFDVFHDLMGDTGALFQATLGGFDGCGMKVGTVLAPGADRQIKLCAGTNPRLGSVGLHGCCVQPF